LRPNSKKGIAMKKAYIVVLILIAAAVGIIISSYGKFSTYETFETAMDKPGSTFHVVGQLDTARPQIYDPIVNPNQFVFYAKDKDGNSHKVIFNGTKPQDFERAEQLVMVGKMDGNDFRCSSIQMKCPSKYEADKIAVANGAGKTIDSKQ
jgi:cytochrome c-type biogenesis protein CcmE